MLDVRLISVIPAQPSIAQPGTAQTVTTQAGAPVLPQLPNGTVLSGFIINRDPSGNPILRTETGDVIFASNFFLKIGSEVVLRLQTTAGKQAAHLISVNGQPPEVAASQSAFSDEPDIIIGQKQPITREQTQATQQTAPAAQAAASTLPKIGQTISGIVITPAFTPALPATVAPGTSLLLSVLGFTLPATQPASSSALTQLTTPGAQPAAPPATNNALASLLPATPQPAQPAAPSPPTAQAAIPTAAPGINSAPSAARTREGASG